MGPFKQIQYTGTIAGAAAQTTYIGSWYGDDEYPVFFNGPWAARGGLVSSGTEAGLFSSRRNDGRAVPNASFRLVLAF